VAKAAPRGDEGSQERHVARGQLLRRDRVEHLLDPGSPFLDIGQLAATDMSGDEVPGSTQCCAFALTVHLRQIECSATSRTLFRHM